MKKIESIEMSVRCKAYSTQGVSQFTFSVERDMTIRVWDDVAQHYTTCHALGASAAKRIRGLARQGFTTSDTLPVA